MRKCELPSHTSLRCFSRQFTPLIMSNDTYKTNAREFDARSSGRAVYRLDVAGSRAALMRQQTIRPNFPRCQRRIHRTRTTASLVADRVGKRELVAHLGIVVDAARQLDREPFARFLVNQTRRRIDVLVRC